MKLSEFDFELPEELIAQHPVEKRDTSRLMVVNRENGNIEHRHFYDILDYLKSKPIYMPSLFKTRRCFSKK